MLLAGLDASVDGLANKVVVVAHHPGAGLAQGGDHGAGQRCHVHQPGDALLPGVTEGVGQHQASLGVGIDYLDRLTVHGTHYVAGPLGATAGHILSSRDNPGNVYFRLQTGDDLHRGDD